MAKVICIYHDGKFVLPERDGRIREGDQVVVLTHDRNLEGLRKRWTGKAGE